MGELAQAVEVDGICVEGLQHWRWHSLLSLTLQSYAAISSSDSLNWVL